MIDGLQTSFVGRGDHTPPYEKAIGNRCVGADDSVGPVGNGTVIVRAGRVARPYRG